MLLVCVCVCGGVSVWLAVCLCFSWFAMFRCVLRLGLRCLCLSVHMVARCCVCSPFVCLVGWLSVRVFGGVGVAIRACMKSFGFLFVFAARCVVTCALGLPQVRMGHETIDARTFCGLQQAEGVAHVRSRLAPRTRGR